MDHIHPETSNLMTTLRSVIETSVAAGFERYVGEPLGARIEREVSAALNRRLAIPHRQPNAQSIVTVPSDPGTEPLWEAGSNSQPHSQYVPEASSADSVRSVAPVGKRRPPVTKPAKWNIIDLTDVFEEQPEESLNVTSSIGHRVADTSDSLMSDEQGHDADDIDSVDTPDYEAAASTSDILMPDEQGTDTDDIASVDIPDYGVAASTSDSLIPAEQGTNTDNIDSVDTPDYEAAASTSDILMPDEQGTDTDDIASVDAPGHEAAASTIRADWIQEARISTPKRSFEAMAQRAPTADMHANPHKRSRPLDPQKTASEEVGSCDSEEVDSYDSEEVDSYDSEEVDSYDSEEVDSYYSEVVDSHDSDEVDSYDSEEFDSSDSEELDSHDSDEVDSCDSREPALVTPPTTKAAKKANLPGYTTGPPVIFLKVSSQLTADPNRRGWPRIVDLKDFRQKSNKQNLTMADIVATILWKHGPKTLKKFLDFEGRPDFYFIRWQLYVKSEECWISRYLDDEGVVTVACGQGSLGDSLERARDTITKAEFTYRVAENGR